MDQFWGDPDSAADFSVEVAVAGPDLAVLQNSIRVYPSGSPGAVVVAMEDATIEVTVKNVGDKRFPDDTSLGAIYIVALAVWDIRGEGVLDTKEAKRLGRAVLQADQFQVLLPALLPGEAYTVKIPQDVLDIPRREGYLFTSTAYSDELEINFLAVPRDLLACKSNSANNKGIFRPFGPVPRKKVALNCISELWTVGMAGMLNGSLGAEFARDIFSVLHDLGSTYLMLVVELKAAAEERDPIEGFKTLGKLFLRMGKAILKAGWKSARNVVKVVSLAQAMSNEWNNVGCGAVFPEVKVLIWSMMQGMLEELNSLGEKVFGSLAGCHVDVLVTDSTGRRVTIRLDGTVESGMPEAVAFRIEDVNTGAAVVPQSDTHTFQVLGQEVGTARVGLIQRRLNESVSTVIYDEVPQQQGSAAIVTVGPTTTEYPLQVDVNGDGTIDETRSPSSVDISSPPPVAPLVFVTASLPDAQVGIPYSVKLEAAGGQPPYLFTLA